MPKPKRKRKPAVEEPSTTDAERAGEEQAPGEQQTSLLPPGNWLQPPFEAFRPPMETLEDDKGKPFERLAYPNVPSAWREGGYLLLVVGVRTDRKNVRQVECILTQGNGEIINLSVNTFWARVAPFFPESPPVRLVLSFLARQNAGIFTMRIADAWRLVTLVTPERLADLSERQLAEEYCKLVDPRGPARIRSTQRDEAIEKILVRAKEIGAKVVVDSEGNANKKIKEPKVPKEKKEKKAKVPKEPKAPKAKREKRELVINPANPFREGSMKRKAYDVFIAEKGDRAKVVEATVALGATKSTATSWYSAFCKV